MTQKNRNQYYGHTNEYIKVKGAEKTHQVIVTRDAQGNVIEVRT